MERTIDINLSGVFLSNKYSIEQFLKQGTGGVIVNAGSIHSFVSLPTTTAYSSAKGGVKLLTQNLCTAYAKYGIRNHNWWCKIGIGESTVRLLSKKVQK